MIKFVSNIENFKRVAIKINGMGPKMYSNLHDELIEGANLIRNWIVRQMQQGPKTGERYARGRTKRGRVKWHKASAPGEVPAVDTGELLRSITIDIRAGEIEVGSEAGAPYAVYLEEGVPNRMEKRPFLQPAMDENLPIIEQNVLRAVEKSAEEAFRK